MNVLFINYYDFSSNSAIHIFNFANQLEELGVNCIVAVPRNKQSIHLIGKAIFEICNFEDLKKQRLQFRNQSGPDIIHAWTPRELVRQMTVDLLNKYKCAYIVHLEDNEEAILEDTYNIHIDRLRALPEKILNRIINKSIIHPIKYRDFLQNADGITAIIDKLLDFKPKDIPGKVVWPGFEEKRFYPRQVNMKLKLELGIPLSNYVVVYSGNVHHSNKKEVYSLYLAIATLNRKGLPVTLIRTGRDFVDFLDEPLDAYKDCFINLGFVDRSLLPEIMSLSDVFVQPGGPDKFNDYRFPSKLPEFFAMGKPVILPNTNIAEHLIDGKNCILLKEGNSIEICEKLNFLLNDPSLHDSIGRNGNEFAIKHFSWASNTKVLYDFYVDIESRRKK